MAKAYLAKADARSASLALQQVLRANPRNIEANRMMAVLTDGDPPAALGWRKNVVDLDPASSEDRLALAQEYIVNGDFPSATNTLAGATEASKQTPAYHNIAGMADLMAGQAAEAEANFSESIRLDPSDPIPQLNLAVVRLHGSNTLDMAEARIALQRIIMSSTNATLRIQGRRELINDALHFKDFPTALNLSKELVQQTNSIFKDKLFRLDVLKAAQNSEFKPTLALYQSEAATDPDKISELAQWQMTYLSPAEALGWLRGLPTQTRTNQTAEVLIATCLLQLKDWRGLQQDIQQQDWEDPLHWWNNLEFVRHAYLARSLRGQGLTEASRAEWGVAVKSASDQKSLIVQKTSFKKLFDLTLTWKWGTEAEEILWSVVNTYPDERWAYPILRNVLIIEHRTRPLNQLMATMYKRMPNDLALKNNLAATSLLLGDLSSNPYKLAQEVYEKDPKNPQCASTYAYALYLQGKYADALKVMQQLNPKDLEAPSIALYYGLVLEANGNKKEARAYLDRVSRAQLWTEEQALFDKAKSGL